MDEDEGESPVHRGRSDGDDEDVYHALGDELGRLTGRGTFTIAGFAGDHATIFEISRDEHGTPTPFRWTYTWDDDTLHAEGPEPDRWLAAMADPGRFYRQVAPKFIVRTPQPLPGILRDLPPAPRDVAVYTCRASLEDLVRAAVRDSPLVLGYELAVLKRVPAGHTGAGQLFLTGQHLFAPGDTQGCQAQIRIRCEPTDDDGTAFAVVTREPRPDLPWHAQPMQPLQVNAAVVPPGSYELTAVLTRPGRVRLQGLPVRPGRSSRSWDDLVRLVPGQLTTQPAAHLVCLIEVCGGDGLLRQRIDWLEDLITKAQSGASPLRVSVVSYGAHGVAWRIEDRPPQIRAWAASPDAAINALRALVGRRLDDREYQRAAQLECALKLVRERLPATGGRPVIVTAGGRPAHPPAADTSRQLIPCPDWVDWAAEMGRLVRLPGITFGALRDPKCRGRIWELLGEHAAAAVDDAVDMDLFAADLGLRAAVQTVPFPVIE